MASICYLYLYAFAISSLQPCGSRGPPRPDTAVPLIAGVKTEQAQDPAAEPRATRPERKIRLGNRTSRWATGQGRRGRLRSVCRATHPGITFIGSDDLLRLGSSRRRATRGPSEPRPGLPRLRRPPSRPWTRESLSGQANSLHGRPRSWCLLSCRPVALRQALGRQDCRGPRRREERRTTNSASGPLEEPSSLTASLAGKGSTTTPAPVTRHSTAGKASRCWQDWVPW
jgi:hypothetical protein